MSEDPVGKFGTVDYVVFSCMLAISVGIGIYHAFAGGKQKTTKEFLLADRNMSPIPVAMSLLASFISAITVLGTPAENYIYGSMFWIYIFAYVLAGLAVGRFFLPLFFRLNVTSANEVCSPGKDCHYLYLIFFFSYQISGRMYAILSMTHYYGRPRLSESIG